MAVTAPAIAAVIDKKHRGGENTREDIESLIAAYTAGELDDESMTLWLRAVCRTGMSLAEMIALTDAMVRSGEVIDWSDAAGAVVDKHSTGGVGDAVTLVAVPLAAALGVKVAKLSGRALGHTGGSIDKLECIPGLRTQLGIHEFKQQALSVGCAIAEAGPALAPADKKLYALRHRTGTVASIPLVASSVMSKKIAAGAPAIVLDVKVGRGAFVQTLGEAQVLARSMVAIGKQFGRRVRALLTDMDAPLADSVGDALELGEALDALSGGGSQRLHHVVAAITDAMLEAAGSGIAGSAQTRDSARGEAIASGRASQQFRAMVAAQGGNLDAFDRAFAPPVDIEAPQSGYLSVLDADTIGRTVAAAKARVSVEEARRIGVLVQRHIGDSVRRGEPVLRYHGPFRNEEWVRALQESVIVADRPPEPRALILDRID